MSRVDDQSRILTFDVTLPVIRSAAAIFSERKTATTRQVLGRSLRTTEPCGFVIEPGGTCQSSRTRSEKVLTMQSSFVSDETSAIARASDSSSRRTKMKFPERRQWCAM